MLVRKYFLETSLYFKCSGRDFFWNQNYPVETSSDINISGGLVPPSRSVLISHVSNCTHDWEIASTVIHALFCTTMCSAIQVLFYVTNQNK